MKYIKKPLIVDAIQWTGINLSEAEAFTGMKLETELESETAYVAGVAPPLFSVFIETKEGKMKAMPKDWIIKGIKGEFYPCKDDIFKASYDEFFEGEFGQGKMLIKMVEAK